MMRNILNRIGILEGRKLLLPSLVSLPLLLVSCGEGSVSYVPHRFPVPEIPSVLGNGPEATEYLSERYWDIYTDTSSVYPCDSAMANGVSLSDVEQAFTDWISLLETMETSKAARLSGNLFSRIETFERKDTSSNVFEVVSGLMEKYLYDPNSPYRDEDLYLPFASGMASSAIVPESRRAVYCYDAEMCSLNRKGTQAADFIFCDRYGKRHSLHGIEAGYTLLFFSNPGCEACRNITAVLESDPVISSMISDRRLAVVNIYIDEDLEQWMRYADSYPEEWTSGYDPDFMIRTDLLYNVRAIPSLYLLDRDKNVILKDAPENRLFSVLRNIG